MKKHLKVKLTELTLVASSFDNSLTNDDVHYMMVVSFKVHEKKTQQLGFKPVY